MEKSAIELNYSQSFVEDKNNPSSSKISSKEKLSKKVAQ